MEGILCSFDPSEQFRRPPPANFRVEGNLAHEMFPLLDIPEAMYALFLQAVLSPLHEGTLHDDCGENFSRCRTPEHRKQCHSQ